MSAGTIVLLPGATGRAELIEDLASLDVPLLDIDLPMADPAPLSVRACAAIHGGLGTADPDAPCIVIAPSESALIVPAVSLAQRRAGRAVGGYVLIEPGEDPTSGDWPDARVVVVAPDGHPSLRRAELRGWERRSDGVLNAVASLLG